MPNDSAGPQLTPDQITRYRRHLILPEVGVDGQKKLLTARVLCVGAGGLGSPIALYLAAAGVGTIGIADIDVVSPSNLQRQVLFTTSDIGQDKTAAAARRLKDLNPDVNVIEHRAIVNASNVMQLVSGYDIVIDGTDNFPTRYCVNDACVLLRKPNVYGSIFRFEGMVSVFAPHLDCAASALTGGTTRQRPPVGLLSAPERGPCYRCLHPQPPDPGSVPSCAEAGVLGVLPGIIGSLQASESIKLILGIGEPLIGRLLTFSALEMEFRMFRIRRNPQCPVCGDSPTITSPIDYEQFCGVPTIDPKLLEETRAEARRAAKSAGCATAAATDGPPLDARAADLLPLRRRVGDHPARRQGHARQRPAISLH